MSDSTAAASLGPGLVRGRAREWLTRLRPRHALFLLCLVVVAYIVVGPLFFLTVGSFSTDLGSGGLGQLTLDNYVRAYSDGRVVSLLMNSLLFSGGSALVALVVGTGLAWITERTDTPLRSLFLSMSLIPLIMPGVLFAIGWILLIGPRAGILSTWFRDLTGLSFPLNVFSLPGMIVVAGLHWAPLAYLIMSGALRSQDPSLEEAALMSGAGRFTAARRIVMPLTTPALMSLILLLVVRGLETFEVPGLIGLPAGIEVFSSRIYLAVSSLPSDFGLGGAYAISLLVITAIGVGLYSRLTRETSKYATISGKGYRPSVIRLGRWRYLTTAILVLYFGCVVVLPALAIVWNSFLPFTQVPSWHSLSTLNLDNYRSALGLDQIRRAVVNSVLLSVGSASVVVIFGSVVSWLVVRSGIRGRGVLDQLAATALVFPGVVVGVALIWVYLTIPVPIYGTIWILFVAYLTRYMPYGIRFAMSSQVQVRAELEEAALMSGASAATTFRRVVLPLMFPALAAAWVYVVVVSMSEFSSVVFLWSPGSEVLSVVLFDFWVNGESGPAYALGSMLVLALTVLTAVYQRVSRSTGIKI
ncbi:MAG: sugB 2 [Nocardioides sp.]|nr:sugB 2 [Nocardioides sp.]